MKQSQLKEEIENIIRHADSRFLRMVQALALAYDNKNIVAYTPDGMPLTKDDYIQQLNQAEDDIKNGRLLSTAQVKKKVKSWRKS